LRITADTNKLDIVALLLDSRASGWFQLNESSFTGSFSVFEAKFRANFVPLDERRTVMNLL
jgi:hypothetical protein